MLGSTAPLLLAAASMIIAATHVKVGLGWAIAFEVVNDLGFANVFPVGLALYSRAAPKGLTGLMVGIFYLHLFMGNLLRRMGRRTAREQCRRRRSGCCI